MLMMAVMQAATSVDGELHALPWQPRVVSQGGVTLVCDSVDDHPSGSRGDVLSYGQRLIQLADIGTTLPARYGSTIPDEAAARMLLDQHGEAWARRLGELEGCVELIVHASDTEVAAATEAEAVRPVTAPRISGREYLERRVTEERGRLALSHELEGAVAALCREHRSLSSTSGVRLACLVPAAEAEDLRAMVAEWATSRGSTEVVVTGPWPPLSFADTSAS